MSRCFPFPPPGYEKKPRTDEVDLLKKEKHKEKKHKKDKKDKEKREHKEKREKDRSDGKHREKKDRKEKHREKKDKDKEKGSDTGKSSTPGEKNIDGQAEGNNIQKLNQKDQQVKDESKILVEKKQMQLVQSQCGEKPFRNGLPAEKNNNAKFVEELDRRIRDDEKGSASLAVGRIPAAGPKNNEQMDTSLDKLAESMTEKKENILEKRIDYRKMDGQRIAETPRSFGHQVVQSVGANRLEGIARPLEKAGLEEKYKPSKGREEVDKQKDEHKDKNREEKVKTKEKERKKEKKEKKSERKSKGADKFVDSNKNHVPSTENMITPPHLTKYEERSIIACEGVHKKRKEFEANDVLSAQNIIPPHQKKEDADKGNATEGNLMKRKEFEPNGFLIDPFSSRKEFEANDVLSARSVIPSYQKKEDAYKGNVTEVNLKKRNEFEPNGFLIDMDSRPNKVARPSPHGVTDNGRTEACLVMSPSPSIPYNKQVSTNNLKVNGVIGHQPVTSSSTKSSSSTSRAKSNHVAQAPKKPPHPDTKYLKEVLSVPETEEWIDFEDHGWLFNYGKSNTCKGINGMMTSEGSSRVWDKAMEIESADICALPYVIPY